MARRIVQIAVSSAPAEDEPDVVYALDEYGYVWAIVNEGATPDWRPLPPLPDSTGS